MNFAPLIKDGTTTVGTGNVTTVGASIGLQSLAAIGAVGTPFDYTIRKDGSAEWEEGVGTLLTSTTFSRAPTASSNGGALVNFSAGTKDVILGPTAARAKRWDSSTSARLVFTSSLCVSDTDLSMSAPVAGVNQRAKLQSLLDLAANGPLILVWDGAYTVSNVDPTYTLRMRGNTTVMALPGCGALQTAGSTGQMWSNYNPTAVPANIVDKNLKWSGGIWHGNKANQGENKPAIFNLIGVDGLTHDGGIEYRKAGGFAFRGMNVHHVALDRFRVDFGPNNTLINTDGIHFNGPSSKITMTRGEIIGPYDDSIAFNADDAWGEANFTGPFDNVYGPITDVTVDDMNIQAGVFAIRLLSGGSRIDNVRIRNIRGTTTAYGLLLDNYLTPSKAVLAGPGNFGSIEVDGWHMTNGSVGFDWGQMDMHISAKVEQLKLRNITKSAFNNARFPAIRLGEKANIDQLIIDGFTSRCYNGGTYLADQIVFAPGAIVGTAKINGADFYAPNQTGGCPVNVMAGATVSRLLLNGCSGNGFADFVQNDGTVTNMHVPATNNFMDGSGAASTWFLEVGYTEVNAGAVTYAGPRLTANAARKVAVDPFAANIRYAINIKFTGTAITTLKCGVFVRGVNATPYSTAGRVCYAFELDKIAGTVRLGFRSATPSEDVYLGAAVSVSGGLAMDAQYIPSIDAKDNVITAQLRRVSDSMWLQANGTWGATVANCCGGTNNSLGAGGGLQYGAYAIANNSDGSVSGVEFSNSTPSAAA